MDLLKVPLIRTPPSNVITPNRESEMSFSLKQRLRSRLLNAQSVQTPVNSIKPVAVIDEDVMKNVKMFYSDSAELKRFNVNPKIKRHKPLSCFDAIPCISPDNQYLIGWKLMITVVQIVYFLELPAYIFFGPELFVIFSLYFKQFLSIGGILSMGTICLLLFMFDMFLEFQTAYFKHGNPVVKKSKIAYNYLKGYFVFDLIANLTFGIRVYEDVSDYRWVYLLFFFKLPSFIKNDAHMEEVLLLKREWRLVYKITRIFTLLFICINFYCCVFYQIGKLSIAHGENSWLSNNGNFGVINEKELHLRYFYSFYFSLGTLSSTMGYGDIQPLNPFECTWALSGMLFGIIVFVFNMSVFYDIVQEYQELDRSMLRDKIAIHRFMSDKRISQTTKSRINSYLVEFWANEGQREFAVEQRVLEWLGPELKEQLLFEAYGPFIRSVPCLAQFSAPMLRELAIHVSELRLSKGEKIIRDRGNRSKIHAVSGAKDQQEDLHGGKVWLDEDNLYFIQNGSVTVHPTIDKCSIVLEKLFSGQSFGEYSFFTGFPRQSSVTTASYAHLYFISRMEFMQILQHYPQDYEVYCMIRDQILLNKNVDPEDNPPYVMSMCYTCRQLGHVSTTCPITHYQPNPLQLEMAEIQHKQKRKRCKRRGPKKQSALSLKESLEDLENKFSPSEKRMNRNVTFQQEEEPPRRPSMRRQSSILMVQSVSHLGAGEFESDQYDEPKDYNKFFPEGNLSTLIDTYNTIIMDDQLRDRYMTSNMGIYLKSEIGGISSRPQTLKIP